MAYTYTDFRQHYPRRQYATRLSGVVGFSQGRDAPPSAKLDKSVIVTELKNERPQWILSAFGPAKDLPLQLFGGYPREQSREELRLRHYELAAAGNPQEAVQEAQTWFNNAEQQIRAALDDVEGAIQYIVNGENEHPNRTDICNARGGTPVGASSSAPAFGQQSSAPSAPKSPFGGLNPSFGQPSSNSGFGQPSTLGSQPSIFGQPAAASGPPSAFGPPAQLGRPTTSFGQPSLAFGQPAAPAPGFGQPSNPTPAFGQAAAPKPAFRQPSFGQPSAPSAPSPFGQQPSAPASGAPSAFGQKPAAPAFGAPTTLGSSQPSAFGQVSAPQQGAFGQQTSNMSQPSAFDQSTTAPSNPFGQPSQPASTSAFSQATPAPTNPFGQAAPNRSAPGFRQPNPLSNVSSLISAPPSNTSMPSSSQPSSGFGAPPAPANIAPTQPANIPSTSNRAQIPATRDSTGKLRTWNGKPVEYVDNAPRIRGGDGALEKVCFPDGPPTLTKAVELPDQVYDESTKNNYMFMRTHGSFKDGLMPSLPPKREWCSWDF